MEKILGKKWAGRITFFLIAAVVVAAGVRYTAFGPVGPAPKSVGIRVSDWMADDLSIRPGDRLMLYLGQEVPVRNARIVYSGSKRERLYLDIRIPALDPVYVYRHEIPLDDARTGIRLAGMGVALKTARMGYLAFEVRD